MLPEGTVTTEEQMTIDERYKYLRKMRMRYLQAGRLEQGELLSEMEVVLGLHRKSLIRLMHSSWARSASPPCSGDWILSTRANLACHVAHHA